MIRTLVFLIALTCSAQAQFMPFAMWKSTSAPAPTWTPLSLGMALKFAFEADSITGKGDGDTLYHWRNLARSNVGSQLFQLTASKKPILRDSSGVKWVRFDGVDDVLRTTTDTTYSRPYTIVAVMRTFSPLTSSYPVGDDGASFSGGGTIYSETGITGLRAIYSDGSSHVTNIEMWDDSLRAQLVTFNGASSSYEHRTLNKTWSANFGVTGSSLAGRSIGSSRPEFESVTAAAVKVYAYYVYVGTLSADDKTAFWNYINQRWGL